MEAFLVGLGLGHKVQAFRDEDINDIETLRALNKEELREFLSVGQATKVMMALLQERGHRVHGSTTDAASELSTSGGSESWELGSTDGLTAEALRPEVSLEEALNLQWEFLMALRSDPVRRRLEGLLSKHGQDSHEYAVGRHRLLLGCHAVALKSRGYGTSRESISRVLQTMAAHREKDEFRWQRSNAFYAMRPWSRRSTLPRGRPGQKSSTGATFSPQQWERMMPGLARIVRITLRGTGEVIRVPLCEASTLGDLLFLLSCEPYWGEYGEMRTDMLKKFARDRAESGAPLAFAERVPDSIEIVDEVWPFLAADTPPEFFVTTSTFCRFLTVLVASTSGPAFQKHLNDMDQRQRDERIFGLQLEALKELGLEASVAGIRRMHAATALHLFHPDAHRLVEEWNDIVASSRQAREDSSFSDHLSVPIGQGMVEVQLRLWVLARRIVVTAPASATLEHIQLTVIKLTDDKTVLRDRIGSVGSDGKLVAHAVQEPLGSRRRLLFLGRKLRDTVLAPGATAGALPAERDAVGESEHNVEVEVLLWRRASSASRVCVVVPPTATMREVKAAAAVELFDGALEKDCFLLRPNCQTLTVFSDDDPLDGRRKLLLAGSDSTVGLSRAPTKATPVEGGTAATMQAH